MDVAEPIKVLATLKFVQGVPDPLRSKHFAPCHPAMAPNASSGSGRPKLDVLKDKLSRT